MKFNIAILSFLIMLTFSLSSCQRKSGRKKPQHQILDTRIEQSNSKKSYHKSIELSSKQKQEEENRTSTSNVSRLTLMELFKKHKSTVFMIYTSDGKEGKQGSGFFISPSGIGVSNYHVFESTNKGLEVIKLESGEEFKISEVIEFSKEKDYIIFKVDSNKKINFLNIAPYLPEIGEEVFAIGNPQGLEHTLSKGIISGYRGNNKELIQTTTEITHGSSGGPLLNMKGEVIGITTMGLGEANLNFAINLISIPSFQSIKKKNKRINPDDLFIPRPTTNQIVNHKYYSLSYSEEDEQAEWVAYKIISRALNNVDRTDDFRDDPYVSTGSADIYDYQGSGYDRGHLAPAKTMSLNEIAMSESFYMSNMSPQIPEFNRGIWKRLEGKVRYWAEANDSLYVVTGPILNRPIDLIGSNDVTVPRAFYKTLLGFKNGKIKGIAFIMPNQKSDKSLYSFAVSIDEVEDITGIDFYYNLDVQIQKDVEANTNVKLWFLKK